MTYDAGSAIAKYGLDVSGFEQGATRVITLYEQIAKAAKETGRSQPTPQTPKPTPIPSVDPAIRANQRLADSAVRAATASRDYEKALSLVDSELNKTLPDTERYNNLLARQATLSRQAAAEARRNQGGGGGANGPALPRTFAGFTGAGLLQGAGVAGLITALPQIQQYLESSGELYRVTLRSDNSLKALAGSSRLYGEAITAAREQQKLFGGSLAENIDGISGLVTVSRSSGAELNRLIDLSQRLSIKDPQQGIGGARIALNEALSGDPTSLARRYEIPKAELAKLRDTSTSTTEKLDLLDKYLNRIGITSEVVAGSIPKDTIAINSFNQSLERSSLAIGSMVSKLQTAAIQSAVTGTEILGLKINTDTVTRGVEVAANGFNVWIQALQQGKSVNEAGQIALANLATGQVEQTKASEDQAQATQQVIDKQNEANAAITEGILKGQAAELQDQRTTAIKQDLQKVGADVALGLYDQSDAAAYLAAKYPELRDQVELMITQEARLAQGTAIASALLREQANQTKELATGLNAASPGRQGNGDSDIDRVVALQQATKEYNKAEQDKAYALANTAGRVTILRGELAKLTPGTAAYVEKSTDLELATRQLASEQEKAATKGAKTARSQMSTLDTVQNKYEDHYRKLVQLQEDYQERSARSLEDFNLRGSRDTEDYQQKRRKLLAEGKIAEANQLKAEFDKDQRRAAEDFQIQQSRAGIDVNQQIRRENESSGIKVGRVIDKAAIRGVRVPGLGSGTAPEAIGGTLPTGVGGPLGGSGQDAGGNGATLLRITFAPIALQLNGKTIAEASYQDIERLLLNDAALVEIASRPQTGAIGAVGGPRP